MSGELPKDSDTIGLGLLMESAHAQQRVVEGALEGLREHTRGLDAVVRAEIRRTLIEELGGLIEHAQTLGRSFEALDRTAVRRALPLSLMVVLSGVATAAIVIARLMPSGTQLASLRAERAQMQLQIDQLARNGGRLELRRCGSRQRLCVRIERQEPAYGADADFLIVKGY